MVGGVFVVFWFVVVLLPSGIYEVAREKFYTVVQDREQSSNGIIWA